MTGVRIEVLPRSTPAAHVVLVDRRVLVDAGDPGDAGIARVEAWLAEDGRGDAIELLALTHGHADHAGGAGPLAEALGVPVALHRADDATVARDAVRLHQWLGPFAVGRWLQDGDVLAAGLVEVVHTPSQTPGHVAYWVPAVQTLVTGDLLQRDDAAWLPFDAPALDQAISSVQRLGELGAIRAIPGHGPVVEDVPAAVARTLATYARWREDRPAQARHHARRMVAAWLALQEPAPSRAEAVAGAAGMPVLAEVGAVLGLDADAAAAAALDQLIGSGAVALEDGALLPRFSHELPSPLRRGPGDPRRWPAPLR